MAKWKKFVRKGTRSGGNGIQKSVRDGFRTRGAMRIGLTTQTAGGVIQCNLLGGGASSNNSFVFSCANLGIADPGFLALGEMFTQWKFKRFRVVYRCACATQNGSFVMAISDDPDESFSSGTFSNIAANLDLFRCKRHISVWKDGSLKWAPRNTFQWYYTSGGDAAVTDADRRMQSQVTFYWSTDGGGVAAADANMGSLLLEYEVEYRGRRPIYSSLTKPIPSVDGSSSSGYDLVENVEEDVSPQVVLSRTEYNVLVALGKRS